MSTSAEVLATIEAAFLDAPKPEHFMEYIGDPECTEHDELLRVRDRDTLKIEDVGNICWQPISYCSPVGMAYYMPSLARLALAEPTYEFGWYGDTLHIHLSSNGSDNDFLRYCSGDQRLAVATLLRHLDKLFPEYEMRLTESEEFEQCAKIWSTI